LFATRFRSARRGLIQGVRCHAAIDQTQSGTSGFRNAVTAPCRYWLSGQQRLVGFPHIISSPVRRRPPATPPRGQKCAAPACTQHAAHTGIGALRALPTWAGSGWGLFRPAPRSAGRLDQCSLAGPAGCRVIGGPFPAPRNHGHRDSSRRDTCMCPREKRPALPWPWRA
jgi:hypothetical protein